MSNDTALMKIDVAKKYLSEAKSLVDILEIRDIAVSAHAYATAKNADEAAQKAMEIKLRAERKAGEFLKEMPKHNGGRPLKTGSIMEPVIPTLDEIGVDKKESHRWQRIADIPKEQFEEYINNATKRTQSTLLRLAESLLKEDEEIEIPKLGRKPLELYCGDILEVCNQLEPESIDIIITDPPYGKEYLELYDKLGEAANKVLKKNGSLIAMSGQSYLSEIMNHLNKHLTYNWTVAYLTPGGQSAQLWQRKVNTFWKPLLWYVKGTYQGKWLGDVTRSNINDNDKRFMGWQQSESGMADIIERFTELEQIVLDPFMGSGTTGWVALALNRQFIGIEINEEMFNIASKRLGIEK